MMKQPTVRPARAAIAAVLAFAPTSLLAQEVAPAAPPPVTVTQTAPPPLVAAPPAVAPTTTPAPAMAAPAPVVQPTPAPVPAMAEATPQTPTPRAERPAPARAAPVVTREVAAAPSVTPPTAEIAQVPAAPMESSVSAEPTQDIAPVEVAPASAESGNGLEWGLAGGALVLVAGLGAMAMRRRRRTDEAAMLSDPVTSTQPIQPADDQFTYAPERQPALALTPAMAATTVRSSNAAHGSLESMVEASPSRENPFMTRKNRLRRAHFLLRQQEAPGANAEPVETVATQTQTDRRQSVTYDFGKASMSQRRGFRPATT